MRNCTRRNLGAFTAVEYDWGYPPYVSINEDRGIVSITVRAKASVNGCGETVTVDLLAVDFAKLAREALANL